MFNRFFGGQPNKTVAPVSAKTSENVVGAIQSLAEVNHLNFCSISRSCSLCEIPSNIYKHILNAYYYLVLLKSTARRVA